MNNILNNVKLLSTISLIALLVGGINLGLLGLFGFNLIGSILGIFLLRLVYVFIGISAGYLIYLKVTKKEVI